MAFWVMVIFIVLMIVICLDVANKIQLTHFSLLGLILIFAPHFVLINYFLNEYVKTHQIRIGWQILIILETVLFLLYFWVKLNIVPVIMTPKISTRISIMMGGRYLVLSSLYAGLVQIILYAFGYSRFISLSIPLPIFIFDAVISLLFILFLFTNGIIRIFCTSRRLSIIRRLIILGTIWIPLINLAIILYTCHLVKLEYVHECYKFTLRNTRVDSQICKTKYPLFLVHGVGFRDLKHFNYWGRIPKELIRNGATVYYGNQEAWGTIENNARDMKERILNIVRETGCGKVNIIAHSKGGLDSRYLIGMLDMQEYVASLTTMSTPHHGSKVIDFISFIPDKIYRVIARTVDGCFRRIGDSKPDFFTASKQFSTQFSKNFNEQVKDSPQVYYQSYTTVMKNAFSDSLLAVPYCVVKLVEGENDGLVCVDSAKWGEFKGVLTNKSRRGISHGDMIDLKREDYNGFDIIEKYVEIVADLKCRGY